MNEYVMKFRAVIINRLNSFEKILSSIRMIILLSSFIVFWCLSESLIISSAMLIFLVAFMYFMPSGESISETIGKAFKISTLPMQKLSASIVFIGLMSAWLVSFLTVWILAMLSIYWIAEVKSASNPYYPVSLFVLLLLAIIAVLLSNITHRIIRDEIRKQELEMI